MMNIKYAFIVLISVLLIISISQMLPIPPFENDAAGVYKSGYFNELDKGFLIIQDSFIGIKTLGKPVYGWIFLQDIRKSRGISVKVYDRQGREVIAPGDYAKERDAKVLAVINSMDQNIKAEVSFNTYRAIIPLQCEDKCVFCHDECRTKKVIGAMSFERRYDAHVYYSHERILIFLVISIILSGILFLLFRWDPGRNVKELFDK